MVFAEVAATCGDDVLHAVTATQSPPASTVRTRPVRTRPVRAKPNGLWRDVVVDFIEHPSLASGHISISPEFVGLSPDTSARTSAVHCGHPEAVRPQLVPRCHTP